MNFRKLLFLLTLSILFSLAVGCSTESQNKNNKLSSNNPIKKEDASQTSQQTNSQNEVKINLEDIGLTEVFPLEEGTTWYYNGMAEVDHTMILVDKSTINNNTVLIMQGFMDDGLGPIGLNGEERTFLLEYTIDNEKIIEKVTDETSVYKVLMSNKIILKAPLKLNNTWEETFEYNDKTYKAVSSIIQEEYTKDGEKDVARVVVETVVNGIEGYKDNIYKETRIFEVGKGLIFFSNTLPTYDFSYGLYKLEKEELWIDKLYSIFPHEKGFTWYYNGYAEYGHIMSLDNISENRTSKTIFIKGYMNDGFDDPDPNGKRTFTITYDINNLRLKESIFNNEDKSNTLNSIIPDKTVLMIPLEEGNIWEEHFTYEGKKYLATSTIEEIRLADENNISTKEYVVKTIVEGIEGFNENTYVEERVYKEGYGLVSFTNSVKGSQPFVEGELYNFGYGLSRTEVNK